ncbi:MAG: class B sortase [Lachnospiraceae bacterium]|nr:class B sortase [Lachnospiraceae bacterium]
MAAGHTVEGRQFRTGADYAAALRDKKKIDQIRAETNLENPKEVLALYTRMKAGAYRFETMVGHDFDDQIYELAEKYKSQSNTKGKKSQKGQRKKSKQRSDLNKKDGKISLDDLDEGMKREIAVQLRARDKRRRLLVGICALGAVFCFGYFFWYYYLAERSSADYEQLASLKNSDVLAADREEPIILRGEEEKIELPEVLDEYKTLFNKNKKLIGWLKIDDTIIDYPVMQTSNNDYYLNHNFNQEKDNNGSIFMDAACVAYPRSQNLILYGHHMRSGKMFGDLEKYAKESYYKEHSIIHFDTIYEKSVYQVMYVFRTRVLKENEIAFKYYQFIDAGSVEEFNSNMKEMARMSLYDTGVTAGYGDELLTLSTCDNSQTDGRFVVVAKRIQ